MRIERNVRNVKQNKGAYLFVVAITMSFLLSQTFFFVPMIGRQWYDGLQQWVVMQTSSWIYICGCDLKMCNSNLQSWFWWMDGDEMKCYECVKAPRNQLLFSVLLPSSVVAAWRVLNCVVLWCDAFLLLLVVGSGRWWERSDVHCSHARWIHSNIQVWSRKNLFVCKWQWQQQFRPPYMP